MLPERVAGCVAIARPACRRPATRVLGTAARYLAGFRASGARLAPGGATAAAAPSGRRALRLGRKAGAARRDRAAPARRSYDSAGDPATSRSAANLRRQHLADVGRRRSGRLRKREHVVECGERRCQRSRDHIGRAKGRSRSVRDVVPTAGAHPADGERNLYDPRGRSQRRRPFGVARRELHPALTA
jgi:hypothetical protein